MQKKMAKFLLAALGHCSCSSEIRAGYGNRQQQRERNSKTGKGCGKRGFIFPSFAGHRRHLVHLSTC